MSSTPTDPPGPAGPHDAELAVRAGSGDQVALAAIFDRHAQALLNFCRSMVRNEADAEDCLQNVFVTAATKLSGLREPERLRSWLFAVARHECLAKISKAKKEVPVDEIADTATDSDDPVATALDAELRQLVQAALDGLPERDRLVLELADRQGLATDDVAAALGMPGPSAYKLLVRARATARRSIGALIVARTDRGECPELTNLLVGWEGRLNPLLRKRVARHIEDCEICAERERRLVTPTALLGSTPAMAMPIALRSRVLDAAAQARRNDTSTGSDQWVDGWPPAVRPARKLHRLLPALAALVALAVVGLVITQANRGSSARTAADPHPHVASSAPAQSAVSPGANVAVTTGSSASVAPIAPSTAVPGSRTARVATTATTAAASTTSTPHTAASTSQSATAKPTIASAAKTPTKPVTAKPTTASTASPKPSTAPVIESMTVQCVYSQTGGAFVPVLTWATRNASAIALSVDNPGVVGSYGTYGPAGTLDLPPNGCNPAEGVQTYTIDTVGGTGPAATRTIRWAPPTNLTPPPS